MSKISHLFERLLFNFLFPKIQKKILRAALFYEKTEHHIAASTNTACLAFYFDIMKAFDSVPHDGLWETFPPLVSIKNFHLFLTLTCSDVHKA